MLLGAVVLLWSQLASASPLPGPDRPRKQADYAALSHPANTRTVAAPTTVEQPRPLRPAVSQPQYSAFSGYY